MRILARPAQLPAEEVGHIEIPISPVAFGLVTLVVLLALLAITYAFRSVGSKH